MYISLCLCTETGGSEVNPEHEPHIMKGGITAEMQVRGSGGVGEGIRVICESEKARSLWEGGV